MSARLKLGAQALAVGLVALLLALLVWKLAQGSGKEAEIGKPAPDFTLNRVDEGGKLQLASLRGGRRGLRERLALADRAHQLPFELGQRRLPLAGRRRCGQHQRQETQREKPHDRSACSTPLRRAAASTAAATWPTSFPVRSMKKVSGRPVSPYLGEVTLWLSWTSG